MMEIWRSRNNKIFNNQDVYNDRITKLIIDIIWMWMGSVNVSKVSDIDSRWLRAIGISCSWRG